MKKLIRILAVLAAGLVVFEFTSLLISIPFQRLIGRGLHYSQDILGMLPKLPWIPLLMCILRLGCILPLVFVENKKGSFVLELILFICMATVLPGIQNVLQLVQTTVLGRMGAARLAANGVVNNVSSYFSGYAGIGQALAYGVCGMRIVSGRLHREN